MDSTITILGAGAMGTACAMVLAENPDCRIRLWARNPLFAEQIQTSRENSRLLPGVRLPEHVSVSSDPAVSLANSDVVVIAIPTRGLRSSLAEMKSLIPSAALMVSTVKGIEVDTLVRPSQIVTQVLGQRPVVVLGGPCHAEEIARKLPASIVAASDALDEALWIQSLFSSGFLRVYANEDQTGVELAGALKNVIAIASGIGDGLGLGDNARAALLTRGLSEITRFGIMMGGKTETFFGLAGVGDLAVTCGSRHSRNRAVGEMLGSGMTLPEIEASMKAVAEGVLTTRSVVRLAHQKGIDMPIASAVHAVLFESKSPAEETWQLMRRPLKAE